MTVEESHKGGQANAGGALSLIAQNSIGKLLLGCAAVGFLLLAAARAVVFVRSGRPFSTLATT